MNLASVEDRGGFAEFRYSGSLDLAEIARASLSVLVHCQSEGLKGALIDLRETEGTLDPLERIDFARSIAPEWNRDILLAFVLHPSQHVPSRPGELAAQNRGMRTRTFLDHQMATAWLLANVR